VENKLYETVPEFLEELCEPTASSLEKLTAAWSGLSTESKLIILYKGKYIGSPINLLTEFFRKALSTENDFVRYVVARKIKETFVLDVDDEFMKIIKNDESPLVQNSILESEFLGYGFDRQLDDFFKLEQPKRRAKLRCLKQQGRDFAKILCYGVDVGLKKGLITEDNLHELITDFCLNLRRDRNYYLSDLSRDGMHEFEKGQEVDSLWRAACKLPEHISYDLIRTLPESSGLRSEISKEVLENLTDRQLCVLLDRPDIVISKFRKEIFFNHLKKGEAYGPLLFSALNYNFDLSNSEFRELIKLDIDSRFRMYRMIFLSNSIRLCILKHIIMDIDSAKDWRNDMDVEMIEAHIDFIQNHAEKNFEKMMFESKVYDISVFLSKLKNNSYFNGKLAPLNECILQDDPWGTFTEISEKLEHDSTLKRALCRYISED